ncbi:MAG: DUF4349 domain-containing protein, partial [Polyangiales bacterium]
GPQATGASAPQREAGDATSKATGEKRTAKLEVRAELSIEVESERTALDVARSLESLATAHGGFVELSSMQQVGGEDHLVLRVPPSELPAVRAILASAQKDGTVLRETQTTKDVTDALADVDARLHSARQEESRLLKLLDERTGTLADVLAVERALADVRERVERLEADQRVGEGRVALATVDVFLRSHVSPAADVSLASRVKNAASDGLLTARDALTGALFVLLRIGPTLALFGGFAFALWSAFRRLRRPPVA